MSPSDEPAPAAVNPPPEQAAVAAFVFREVVAVLFVGVWLLFYAGELVTGSYTVPVWFHCCGVGTLAYALGLNVATLVVRPPTKRAVARAVVKQVKD